MIDGAIVDDTGGIDCYNDLPFGKILADLGKSILAGSYSSTDQDRDQDQDDSRPASPDHDDSQDKAPKSEVPENNQTDASGSQRLSGATRQPATKAVQKQTMATVQDVVTEAQKAPVFGDNPVATTFLLL